MVEVNLDKSSLVDTPILLTPYNLKQKFQSN